MFPHALNIANCPNVLCSFSNPINVWPLQSPDVLNRIHGSNFANCVSLVVIAMPVDQEEFIVRHRAVVNLYQ
jgi:hypothetical protein